jgi:hypothetical protein
MSRLLFAAARGARIQEQRQFGSGWVDTVCIVLPDYEVTPQRIHPDDEAYQYGPISTALRNDGLGLPLEGTCWFAQLALHSDGELHTMSPIERSIFLLILAEALADEGM